MTVTAKKKFGQNFLISAFHLDLLEGSVKKFLNEVKPEKVLEIGPGMGALTKLILSNTELPLICWEIDAEAIKYLQESDLNSKIVLEHKDALEEFKSQNANFQNYVLISNLPYNVGSRVLIESACGVEPPLGVLVMLQKEVGQKLQAKEKNVNVLGGFLRLFYDFKIVGNFPRSAFSPQPKVESVMVQGILKTDLNLDPLFSNRTKTLQLLKLLLKYPNKTLSNNLKNLGFDKVKIDEILNKGGWDSATRLNWQNLSEILKLLLK